MLCFKWTTGIDTIFTIMKKTKKQNMYLPQASKGTRWEVHQRPQPPLPAIQTIQFKLSDCIRDHRKRDGFRLIFQHCLLYRGCICWVSWGQQSHASAETGLGYVLSLRFATWGPLWHPAGLRHLNTNAAPLILWLSWVGKKPLPFKEFLPALVCVCPVPAYGETYEKW